MEVVGEVQNLCNWTFRFYSTVRLLNNSNNLSYDITDFNNGYVDNGYVNGAFSLLFFLVGLPWNALVIGIILKKKLFTRPTYMLMLNLAIANLLVCVLVLPLTVIFGFGGRDVYDVFDPDSSYKVCQTAVFLVLFPLVSTHTVTLLAIDRLIYIKKSLTYQSIVTPRRMLLAITMAWLFCIGFSVPPLALKYLYYSFKLQVCTINSFTSTKYVITMVVESVFVVMLQCVMCAWMICITRKHLKKRFLRELSRVARFRRVSAASTQDLPQNRRNSDAHKEYSKSQLHLVEVFAAIFTASIVTLFMVLVIAIMIPVCGLLPAPLYPLTYLLYLSRAIIHPILEAIMMKEIRCVLQNCLPSRLKVCCRKRGHEDGANLISHEYFKIL